MPPAPTRADWRTPTVILVASALVLSLSMGLRHGFGLFLQPMSADLHWGRETFALAIAVQNLVWGIVQPFTGMIADRYGTARVVVVGALLYALGLVGMAHSTTPLALVALLRPADRHGTFRADVQRDVRRGGPCLPAGKAQHGARHLRGGRVRSGNSRCYRQPRC